MFTHSTLCVCLLGIASTCLGSTLTYTFTTINDPNGTAGTDVNGINNAGEIVGFYNDGTQYHGFTYIGGSYTTFNAPGATGGTLVDGINNLGWIVGAYIDSAGEHGFLDNPALPASFETIDYPSAIPGVISSPNTGGTEVLGINDQGEMVGAYVDSQGLHGFSYDGTTFTPINDPNAHDGPPGPLLEGTAAYGINNQAQIVGYYSSGISPGNHGFQLNGSNYIDVDDPQGTGCCGLNAYTVATRINNNGQIVGYYIDATGIHGFLDRSGQYGQIDEPMATYQPNAAVPGVVTFPLGITDSGIIAGSYYGTNGLENGFVAIPTPEPSALAAVAIAFALCRCGKRLVMS
jgi:hypothetical protein